MMRNGKDNWEGSRMMNAYPAKANVFTFTFAFMGKGYYALRHAEAVR